MPRYEPKEGDLAVWNVINPPAPPVRIPVKNVKQAVELIDKMAYLQLIDPRIRTNAFGLEVWELGEWTEYYDDEGRDVDEISEAMADAKAVRHYRSLDKKPNKKGAKRR